MNTYFVDATAAASMPFTVFAEMDLEMMDAWVANAETELSFPMSGDDLARKRADA